MFETLRVSEWSAGRILAGWKLPVITSRSEALALVSLLLPKQAGGQDIPHSVDLSMPPRSFGLLAGGQHGRLVSLRTVILRHTHVLSQTADRASFYTFARLPAFSQLPSDSSFCGSGPLTIDGC
ncbi:hypothetical protein B0H13DRAFT_2275775 [Mycena leptocephala]|nr:hypothetical protein B0H13DRAFT_2275775 [Mycena leptocephala]